MINTGAFYKRPYESDWNVYRRFYIANPIYKKNTIDNAIKNYVENKRPDLRDTSLTRFEYILEINYPEEKPYHLFESSFCLPESPSRSKSRICPECEKQLFHSHIFSFPWIKYCPIHKVELTWPIISILDFYAWYRPPPIMKALFEEAFDRSKIVDLDTEPFHFIYKLIARNIYEVNEDAIGSLSYSDILCIRNIDDLYPSVLDDISTAENIKLKSLGVSRKPTESISTELKKCKDDQVARSSILYQEKITLLTDWAKRIRMKAVERIYNSINSACGKEHKITLQCRSASRNYLETCPYCISFSLWFFKIFDDNYGEYSRCPSDCIYDDFNGYEPSPPYIATTIKHQGQLFELPIEVSQVLYKKHVEWLFYIIYSYVSYVVQYFSENVDGERCYDSVHVMLRSIRLSVHPIDTGFREVFWKIREGNNIKFQYFNEYSLRDLFKESDKEHSERCNRSWGLRSWRYHLQECKISNKLLQKEADKLIGKFGLIYLEP